MILFVLESGNTLPEKLSIPDDRVQFIVEAVRDQVELLKQYDKQAVQLTVYYKALADVCETLEEYTLAIHSFLFSIMAMGELSVRKNQK